MRKPSRSRAEGLFTATGKKADQYLKTKEKAWQEKMDKTAKLRALRLAKEASEKQASEEETGAAEETARPRTTAKPDTGEKPESNG